MEEMTHSGAHRFVTRVIKANVEHRIQLCQVEKVKK